MVKVNVGGCSSFVKDAEYQKYVGKALEAFDVLESGSGAGNDFLGWKTLPVDTPDSLIADCEAIRDAWAEKGVELVVVIGIGGSYLGARCAIEALSHGFVRKEGVPQIAFAGNNLSEDYLAELMDLAKLRNTACVVISKSGTTTERRERSRPSPPRRDTRPLSCLTTWAAASASLPRWVSCPSSWPASTCAPC